MSEQARSRLEAALTDEVLSAAEDAANELPQGKVTTWAIEMRRVLVDALLAAQAGADAGFNRAALLLRELTQHKGPAVERPTWQQKRISDLEETVRELRVALDLCAVPDEGWPDVFCANAYEDSRVLVPDDAEPAPPARPEGEDKP